MHEPCRQAGGGGTDVRLDLGVPYRPKAWPRSSVDTGYWTWRSLFGVPVRSRAHKNVLELEALIAAVRWRLRRPTALGAVFLNLVDSQVVAVVAIK